LKLFFIQRDVWAYSDAGESGIPGKHVSVHGDNGGRRLVASPRRAGEVNGAEDRETHDGQPENTIQ
jgi:hypothetical protein